MVSLVKDKAELDMRMSGALKKIVILDFFANWCGPCKVCAPKLNVLADQYSEHVMILKVNVDENEDIAEDFNITSMPTFILIKEGEVLDTIIGANMDKLKKSMDKHIAENDVDAAAAAAAADEEMSIAEEQQQNAPIIYQGQGEIENQQQGNN
ncbi:thioredoxin-2 [Drosophila kikkawai]|uniref:Thioredoxin-2 n=1 Tax=Drosophila kikkawai TaxID=30033 RepID=A0A6P4IN34_DROKI|nr:thioredoxin-2 [Drosophila kikkawai]XP_017030383.1 thioredoxin-2 [Drosophila kikkawai]